MKHSSRSVVSQGSGYSHGARSCVILDDSNSSFLCKDDDVFAIPARSRVAETARSKGTREQCGDRSANGAWNHSRLSRIHVSPIPEENRSQEHDDNRSKERARLIADAGSGSLKAAVKATNLSRAKLPADDYDDSKELYSSHSEREEQAALARQSLNKSATRLLPSGNKSRSSSLTSITEKAKPMAKSFSEATPKSPRSTVSGRGRPAFPANSSHAESYGETHHSDISVLAATKNHRHHQRKSNISTELEEQKRTSREATKNRLSSHENNSLEVSRLDYQKSPYNSRNTNSGSQTNGTSAYDRSISKFAYLNVNSKSADLYGDHEPSDVAVSKKHAGFHGSNKSADMHSSNRSTELNGSQRSAEFCGSQRSADFYSSRKSAEIPGSSSSLQRIASGSRHETSQHGVFVEAHRDPRVLPEESPVLEESRLSQDEHQQAILLNQSVHVRPGFDYNGEILRLQKKMGKLQAKIAHMQKKVLHLQGKVDPTKQD